jgi:uncharacterized damage-inducible protein DinB
MTCSFHADIASSQEAIRLSRDELLRVIDSLSRTDLDRSRKGGWPVRRVLEHVIQSERLYAQATAYLVASEASARTESSAPGSVTEARTMLLDSRKGLLKALEPLETDPRGYETFYELRKVGHEEYSVLSVLENVANHDREHAEQIRSILATDG